MIQLLFHLVEKRRSRLAAFLLGMVEFRRDCTWADPARDAQNVGLTDLDYTYDDGREFAHRITLRRFEA